VNPPLYIAVIAGEANVPQQPWQDVIADDEPRPLISAAHLLQPATLDRLLMQVYGHELMPSQLPVLVSQWSKYYFMHLIPAVVVASLMQGRRHSLALADVGFVLDDRGVLHEVRFLQPSRVESAPDAQAFDRFGALLEHIEAVIERLAAYSGVAAGVLWGNAGDYLETCLTQLGESDDVSLAAGFGLLRERMRPDGRRNPLFNAISYVDGAEGLRRQRRSCCLSYRVEWVGRCEHCPLGCDDLSL
jgi:ferric iron reductase protein FhuF